MKPFAMLAGDINALPNKEESLSYPLWASAKFNGYRAHIVNGVVMSRNMKPFPNEKLQRKFGHSSLDGLDGELVAGDPEDPRSFRTSSSKITTHGADVGDVLFYVFDDFSLNLQMPFEQRYKKLIARVDRLSPRKHPHVVTVEHRLITGADGLRWYEEETVRAGFEGVMTRHPQGPYKNGRSTPREQWLMKLKRFEDGEAVIIGAEERLRNHNARDAHGKRTSHKAGRKGDGVLGMVQVRALASTPGVPAGTEFGVGSGFNDTERRDLWADHQRGGLVGQVIKFRYFPVGIKDKPIWPTFEGFRHDIDR